MTDFKNMPDDLEYEYEKLIQVRIKIAELNLDKARIERDMAEISKLQLMSEVAVKNSYEGKSRRVQKYVLDRIMSELGISEEE